MEKYDGMVINLWYITASKSHRPVGSEWILLSQHNESHPVSSCEHCDTLGCKGSEPLA